MIKNKNFLLVVGQFSLAGCILLNNFIKDNNAVSFIVGLLAGLSIVMNIAYLIKYRKNDNAK